MDIFEWVAQYWVSWVCALIAGGIAVFAKHYIKIQKESLENKWKDKEKNMCGKIITNFDDKIEEVKANSNEKEKGIYKELDAMRADMNAQDSNICNDLNNIHKTVDVITNGILSIQGKQFRDMCEELLSQDYISIEKYEEFEDEYAVYKSLGGNHRGDSLHARVVAKCDKQSSKE